MSNSDSLQYGSAPVRIPVPHIKPIREMPLYKDLRELLNGCRDRFGEDIAYRIKTKKATRTTSKRKKINRMILPTLDLA